jgi:tetratricopeptide (TPR) repeat protein
VKTRTIRVLLLVVLTAPVLFAQAPSPVSRAEALLREHNPSEALRILQQEYKTSPKDFKTCNLLALAYTQSNDFENAARFFREALALNPGFTPARKNLGVVLWFANRHAEAEREFLAVLKPSPADPVAHLYMGFLEHERKHFPKAKQHFERAGDLALNNPEALPVVLESYLAAGDRSLADRVMRLIESSASPDTALVFRCGVLFGEYGLYPQAVAALEKIRPAYPDRATLLLNLGMAQLSAKQYRAAAESLEGAGTAGSAAETARVLQLLGEAYDGAGDPQKAFESFSRAVELDPASEDGYIALSNFAAAHHNEEFALKTLTRGLEKNPASGKLLMQQGVLAAIQGDLAQAEKSFRMSSQSAPLAARSLLALGIVEMQAGKLDAAAGTLKLAASKAPEDFRPQYFYAVTLARAGGRSEPEKRKIIVASLQKAISLNARDPESRVELAQAYQAAGDIELAAKELEAALSVSPGHTAALYQLAGVRRRQGRIDEAQRLLANYQEVKNSAAEQERNTLVQIMKEIK